MCFKKLFELFKKEEPAVAIVVISSKFLELTHEQENNLVDIAIKCLGIPYKLGTEIINLDCEPESIKEFDCSELTQYLYWKTGFDIGDGSFNQIEKTDKFEGPLKIGDLFFRKSFSTGMISHVGMNIGNGEIIEANGQTQFRKVVKRKVSDISKDSSLSEFVGFRRLLKDNVRVLDK